MTSQATALKNLAGPVMQAGDLADAVIEAAREDNPDKEILVDDHVAYVRIQAEGGLVVQRKTIENHPGRPFEMRELERNLSGFAGQIDTHTDYVRFFLERTI